MDELCLILEKEYCPPIDSSLFSAIILDYDLSNPDSVYELKSTLNVLKESALTEESTAFDPSGSSGLHNDTSSHGSSDRAQSFHGDIGSVTMEETDLTGLLQGLDSIGLGSVNRPDVDREQHEAGLEELSPEEKAAMLKEMFPNAKDFDVTYTLTKTGNYFGKTVEELLNHAFLEDENENCRGHHVKKGIEAFTEPAINGRGRRGRRKQRQLLRRTSSTPAQSANPSHNSPAPVSRWDRAKEDIDFIAQRTCISPPVITSIYHKNGASLHSTIAALCTSTDPEVNTNPYLSATSLSTLESHVADLALDFQRLSFSQLTALVNLTHPSTTSAHELARALTSHVSSASSAQLIPQYLPREPSPTINSISTASSRFSLPSSTAASLASARSTAFNQAQSAYRKSKSKPLMGGAASYYSSVGRDASATLRRHEAAAAEALVTSQSRSGEVDLHGVTVKDAVNIARARVESWWEREGREWARQGKAMGGGLRVITGAGRHSEGGKGRLGPAVGGMLVREGWKVEVGEGVVEVVGRARK